MYTLTAFANIKLQTMWDHLPEAMGPKPVIPWNPSNDLGTRTRPSLLIKS